MSATRSNRITQRLIEARQPGRVRLAPYLTAGFPDLEATLALVRRFDESGCPVIEIGFPFSDSIADGPTIQESFHRVLATGWKVDPLLGALRDVRSQTKAGLVAMVSMSIVARFGVEAFARRLADCGFDGWIVPDAPLEEQDIVGQAAAGCGLCNVLMVAPTTPQARLGGVGSVSTGFVYLIAARGITGERSQLADDLRDNVGRVRACTETPVLAGFGIHTPAQVRAVCAVADGAIVGSAVVRRVRQCISRGDSLEQLVVQVGGYVDELAVASKT